jgi:hypothetical protein
MLAEAQIGRELRLAQERGEVARPDGSTHHRPKEGVRSADTLPATLPELGIPRQPAHGKASNTLRLTSDHVLLDSSQDPGATETVRVRNDSGVEGSCGVGIAAR